MSNATDGSEYGTLAYTTDIDLGAAKAFNKVAYLYGSSAGHDPFAYNLKKSDDGITWTAIPGAIVASVPRSNDTSSGRVAGPRWSSLSFDAMTKRYLRCDSS